MAQLTSRYRLIWDENTKVIRCCGEYLENSVTETTLASFESDSLEEIQAKIALENLSEPDDNIQ